MTAFENKKAENIFLPREAVILNIKETSQLEKHFTLRNADASKMIFEPGQFLEVSLFGYGEIPIGLASSPTRENSFDIVIRTVGRVSTAINQLKEGDSLYIRGPYGNGFKLEQLRSYPILVVAGGVGVCPTRSLIQYIMDRREEFKSFTLFYGTRDPSQQLFLEDLKQWRCSDKVEYYETVDKADEHWEGPVGLITELFKKTSIAAETRVIICGPPIMFKFVIYELDKIGIAHNHIFVDLERRMKCAIGKCGHCQINNKYACLDGPVFALSDISNLEEAF
ncbi:MAG: FAD/NAD(P)-binding protein [gamma proteobacterium symbiont of Taylorina sp.]|nr:FAD/NAD(P)-binding protein [gamma proteobacterium symbiont of Taylorina sp.]